MLRSRLIVGTGKYQTFEVMREARARKLAVEVGRLAYLAGRIPRKRYATASTPLEGVIGGR